MNKEDISEVADSVVEIASGSSELSNINPIFFFVTAFLLLGLNLYVLFKLHTIEHTAKELVACVYYSLQILNFVLSFYFIDILIKKLKLGKNRFIVYVALGLNIINPLIITFIFY